MVSLLRSFTSVLEKGIIWAGNVGTNTFKLYQSLSEFLEHAHSELTRIFLDTDPYFTSDTIPEWQREFNLPRCAEQPTETLKRNEIISIFQQRKPFKQELVQDLANLYQIGEVLLTRVGAWHLSLRFLDYEDEQIAECGVAECGVSNLGSLIYPYGYLSAECGVAECGVSRLFELNLNQNYFCHLESLLPSWVQLDYNFI